MRKIVCPLLFLLFFAVAAQAQIGIRLLWNANNAPGWEESKTELNDNEYQELLNHGFSFGLDYWFRLRNKRLEFMPEINYARYETTFPLPDERLMNLQSYSFFFNTQIYPFDFGSDCDCPTFSKQNDFFKKGFFLGVSPGVSYFDQRLEIPGADGNVANVTVLEDSQLAFSVGAYLGLDIGLSDFLTVSPQAGLRYFPNASWPQLQEFSDAAGRSLVATDSRILQLQAGMQIRLRFGE